MWLARSRAAPYLVDFRTVAFGAERIRGVSKLPQKSICGGHSGDYITVLSAGIKGRFPAA